MENLDAQKIAKMIFDKFGIHVSKGETEMEVRKVKFQEIDKYFTDKYFLGEKELDWTSLQKRENEVYFACFYNDMIRSLVAGHFGSVLITTLDGAKWDTPVFIIDGLQAFEDTEHPVPFFWHDSVVGVDPVIRYYNKPSPKEILVGLRKKDYASFFLVDSVIKWAYAKWGSSCKGIAVTGAKDSFVSLVFAAKHDGEWKPDWIIDGVATPGIVITFDW